MRNAALLAVLAGSLLGGPCGAHAQTLPGPSFDCAIAQARREPLGQLICLDPGLSRLDLQFVQTYQALRQQVGEAGARDLRQDAIDFQAQTLQRCGVPRTGMATPEMLRMTRACLQLAYEGQRNAFYSRLESSGRAEASRTPETLAAIQGYLRDLGFLPAGATLDGVYGPSTRTAISAWQRATGAADTGFVEDWGFAPLQRAAADARDRAVAADRERQRQAMLEDQRRQEDARRMETERARQAAEDRRRAADAERQARADAVADRLAQRLGDLEGSAAVLVSLGQDGGRLRRNLRGELSLFDPSRPALGCTVAGLGTDGDFLGYAEERQKDLLGPAGRAPFHAACPGPEAIAGYDVILLHRPAAIPAAVATLEAIEARLADKRLQPVGQVTLAAWQDDRRRRQVAEEEEKRRREDLVAAIREDALAGRLAGWAAVRSHDSRSDVACVVADADPRWGAILAGQLPQEARHLARRVQADGDADRQFARLLSGDCGLLVAQGQDFGDVLRGMAANNREGTVLPLRIEAAVVRAALAPVDQALPPSGTQVASPPLPKAAPPADTTRATPVANPAPPAGIGNLPACDAPETFAALDDAIKGNVASRFVNLRLIDLQDAHETPSVKAGGRNCNATAVLNGGRVDISYNISASHMRSGAFLVEIED